MKNVKIIHKRFVDCVAEKFPDTNVSSVLSELASRCGKGEEAARAWYYHSQNRGIPAKYVDTFSEFFDVDVLYLLGLQEEERRKETDTAEYIRMSEDSVHAIRNMNDKQRAVLEKLVSDDSGFTELLDALAVAALEQQTVDELERLNDGIERHINDNMKKDPPEPEEDLRTGWTDTAVTVLNQLEDKLAGNCNGIEAATSGKDLVIRKFYNVLERFVPDITVKKWTMDHFKDVASRIHLYKEEMMDRQFNALQKMNSQ